MRTTIKWILIVINSVAILNLILFSVGLFTSKKATTLHSAIETLLLESKLEDSQSYDLNVLSKPSEDSTFSTKIETIFLEKYQIDKDSQNKINIKVYNDFNNNKNPKKLVLWKIENSVKKVFYKSFSFDAKISKPSLIKPFFSEIYSFIILLVSMAVILLSTIRSILKNKRNSEITDDSATENEIINSKNEEEKDKDYSTKPTDLTSNQKEYATNVIEDSVEEEVPLSENEDNSGTETINEENQVVKPENDRLAELNFKKEEKELKELANSDVSEVSLAELNEESFENEDFFDQENDVELAVEQIKEAETTKEIEEDLATLSFDDTEIDEDFSLDSLPENVDVEEDLKKLETTTDIDSELMQHKDNYLLKDEDYLKDLEDLVENEESLEEVNFEDDFENIDQLEEISNEEAELETDLEELNLPDMDFEPEISENSNESVDMEDNLSIFEKEEEEDFDELFNSIDENEEFENTDDIQEIEASDEMQINEGFSEIDEPNEIIVNDDISEIEPLQSIPEQDSIDEVINLDTESEDEFENIFSDDEQLNEDHISSDKVRKQESDVEDIFFNRKKHEDIDDNYNIKERKEGSSEEDSFNSSFDKLELEDDVFFNRKKAKKADDNYEVKKRKINDDNEMEDFVRKIDEQFAALEDDYTEENDEELFAIDEDSEFETKKNDQPEDVFFNRSKISEYNQEDINTVKAFDKSKQHNDNIKQIKSNHNDEDNSKFVSKFSSISSENGTYENSLKKQTPSRFDNVKSKFGDEKQEKNAWNNAVKKGTYQGFKSYLQRYPKGKFRKQAKILEESALYNESIEAGSIMKINDYLAKYPRGNFAERAKKEIDNVNWQNAVNDDTYRSYFSYIKEAFYGEKSKEAVKEMKKFIVGYWKAFQTIHTFKQNGEYSGKDGRTYSWDLIYDAKSKKIIIVIKLDKGLYLLTLESLLAGKMQIFDKVQNKRLKYVRIEDQ